MATIAGLWKLLAALAGAFGAYQAWQKTQAAATTNEVDTEADQAAHDAASAQTPEEAIHAAQEFQDAASRS